jgi:hypothetical protein
MTDILTPQNIVSLLLGHPVYVEGCTMPLYLLFFLKAVLRSDVNFLTYCSENSKQTDNLWNLRTYKASLTLRAEGRVAV